MVHGDCANRKLTAGLMVLIANYIDVYIMKEILKPKKSK